MKKIILTLLLAAISTGAMAEWIKAEDNWSYDSTSIRRVGDLASMTIATNIAFDGKTYIGLFDEEFDCKTERRSRTKRWSFDSGDWEPPQSGGEWSIKRNDSFWHIACRKAAPSSAPANAEMAPSIPAANPADSASAKSSAFLIASVAAIVGGLVSYLVFKLLGGSVSGSTPVATGRRWMNWLLFSALAFATTKVVGALFSGFSDPGHHFAKAIIVVPFFAPIGFVSGWLFAKIRGPKEEPLTEQPQLPNGENEATPKSPRKETVEAAVRANPLHEKVPSAAAPHKFGPSDYPDFRPAPAGINDVQAGIYEAIANELESGETDKGLWTRLFAESNGDEKKTKVAYINQRAAKLMDAERTRIIESGRKKSAEAARLKEPRIEEVGSSNLSSGNPKKAAPEKPVINGDDEWQRAKQAVDLSDHLNIPIADAKLMVTHGIEKKGDRFILKDGRGYNTLAQAISSAKLGNG